MTSYVMQTRNFESKSQNPESAHELLANSLRNVLRRIEKRQAAPPELFCDAAMGLDALPLSTGAYSQARLNLRNLERYICQKEWGAARFELLSLMRRLLHFWSRTAF